MITELRQVYHRNQGVVEYYVHDHITGYRPVDKLEGEQWRHDDQRYFYAELVHSSEPNADGRYGSHEDWTGRCVSPR